MIVKNFKKFLIEISFAIILGIGFSFFYSKFLNLSFCFFNRSLFFWFVLLVNAIWEEVAFRGIIWELLENKVKGNIYFVSKLNVVVALLFALAHIIIGKATFYRLLTFFPGLVFGYFRENYDTLIIPISLHILYNLFVFCWC